MSRSNPTIEKTPNPAAPFFFEWGGGEGILRRYDKAQEKNITIPLPFGFLVLDELAMISGFNKRAKSGIFSNEVRDTTVSPLVVKIHGAGILANGLYSAIKESVKAAGGHFAKSVYIAFKETKDGALRIGNIRMATSSLIPWIDFRKQVGAEIFKGAVKIKKGGQQTAGANEYYEPKFEMIEASEAAQGEAAKLDKELQSYLEEYLHRNKATEEPAAPTHKQNPTAPNADAAPDDLSHSAADEELADEEVAF